MNIELKPVRDQVIVITGATSGIGLATARLAASRGAKLVLSARSNDELHRIQRELEQLGAEVEIGVADVADEPSVQKLGQAAVDRFGRIDTWVNNAGISVYGRLTETPMNEKRRLFEVNFWGTVYGCKVALKYLRKSGGALINMGSIASERSIVLQGMYSATKHAVKAYTDALRMELEAEGVPVSVTLVKPTSVDTPYPLHSESHLHVGDEERQPVMSPPVYAPEVVASAVLTCAEKPVRDVYVGGAAKFFSLVEKFAPRLGDLYMEKTMMEGGQSLGQRPVRSEHELFEKRGHGMLRGNYPGHVMKSSLYTSATLHPVRSVLLAGGLVGLTGALFSRRSRRMAA